MGCLQKRGPYTQGKSGFLLLLAHLQGTLFTPQSLEGLHSARSQAGAVLLQYDVNAAASNSVGANLKSKLPVA